MKVQGFKRKWNYEPLILEQQQQQQLFIQNMQLLDGRKTAEDIKNEIAAQVQKMKNNGEKVPHLAAVIVGNDGASLTYVGSKVKSCQQIGFESTLVVLPEDTSEADLLSKIKELNEDDDIDGTRMDDEMPVEEILQ